MDADRLHPDNRPPPHILTSNDKKPALLGLNYKNTSAAPPEWRLLKQVITIFLLGLLFNPWLIIRQSPQWQNTSHYQKYAPDRTLRPTYHCRSPAFEQLS